MFHGKQSTIMHAAIFADYDCFLVTPAIMIAHHEDDWSLQIGWLFWSIVIGP